MIMGGLYYLYIGLKVSVIVGMRKVKKVNDRRKNVYDVSKIPLTGVENYISGISANRYCMIR